MCFDSVGHEKYFTVYCPTEVSEYTTLQQKKFFILYNLYVERFKETKKEVSSALMMLREPGSSISSDASLKRKINLPTPLRPFRSAFKAVLSFRFTC